MIKEKRKSCQTLEITFQYTFISTFFFVAFSTLVPNCIWHITRNWKKISVNTTINKAAYQKLKRTYLCRRFFSLFLIPLYLNFYRNHFDFFVTLCSTYSDYFLLFFCFFLSLFFSMFYFSFGSRSSVHAAV